MAEPKPLTAIKLLKPHTHQGRDYPEGTILVLAGNGLDQESAQWLINLNVAEATTPKGA